MTEPSARPVASPRVAWISAGFVTALFLVVWVQALVRLHTHYKGEVFLHHSALIDTLIAILAPLAACTRLFQAYRQTQASRL